MGSEIHFASADESHDAGMRRLLREVPMPGSIRVSLQREPSYFASARMEGPEHHAIVAVSRSSVVGMGSVSVRLRFLNGRPALVGYLGGLRLDPSVQGRFDVIRRGYEHLRQLCARLDLEAIFTSIASDNHRAIRLLERGATGMPTYAHLGDLSTLLLRVKRRRQLSDDSNGPAGRALLQRLNDAMSQFQFAPCWSETELSGLECVAMKDGEGIDVCAALWDQRHFKQAVVMRYPFHLRVLSMLGALPPIGRPISQAFVSYLACPTDKTDRLMELIDRLEFRASLMNIGMLCLGFDDRDPRVAVLRRRYSMRIYRTRLYRVSWESDPGKQPPLDGRLLYPEIALL